MAESNGTVTVGVELVGTNSIDSKAFWLDLLDRTGKTFVQTLLIFVAGGATIASVSWTTALSSAALAALVSFLIALATSTAITSGNFAIDLADRVGRTFVSALVGAIPATGTLSDINWRDALTLAATAALVSVLTSLASSNFGPSKGLPSLAPVQPELIALNDAIVVDESRQALRDDTRREIDIVTAKVFNAGKVFADDLNELNMVGVPILRLLADELGVGKSQVRNLVAEGRVNHGALVRALGRFES
ncbi:holin [Rhodococcus sp. IEGM 1409]|uniref:holin n=1 Tax=Rhodococcus sp. IEGM 1409 TaxID=3047082 RepID=UPI0024B871C9|nr:holin [Rhodococcus sp. IEGM 1409]MDI9903814.1 holin [Rhodococcus sp. IEGM 1409]